MTYLIHNNNEIIHFVDEPQFDTNANNDPSYADDTMLNLKTVDQDEDGEMHILPYPPFDYTDTGNVEDTNIDLVIINDYISI